MKHPIKSKCTKTRHLTTKLECKKSHKNGAHKIWKTTESQNLHEKANENSKHFQHQGVKRRISQATPPSPLPSQKDEKTIPSTGHTPSIYPIISHQSEQIRWLQHANKRNTPKKDVRSDKGNEWNPPPTQKQRQKRKIMGSTSLLQNRHAHSPKGIPTNNQYCLRSPRIKSTWEE